MNLLAGKAALFVLVVLAGSLAGTAVVLAHDHRAVGDYQFTVGFVSEPAIEGLRNGVHLRVEKSAASQEHDHHGGTSSGEHDSMSHQPLAVDSPVDLGIEAQVDDSGGVGVHIVAQNWTWAPENVNGPHVPGEGHAHIYVDGEKVNRVYGPNYYLRGLEEGERHISVTLNANSHNELLVAGEKVEASTMVTVTESTGIEGMEPEPLAASSHMSVSGAAHVDPLGGYNLQVTPTNFTFSDVNAGPDHVPGQGYAKVTIDGEEYARLYGSWFKLPALEPGMHTIAVILVSNSHAPYSWDGEHVMTEIMVHTEAEESAGSMAVAADDSESTHDHDHGELVPVEGLEQTLLVEITHVGTGAAKTMPLYAVEGDPGYYRADLIPTASGDYRFRFFGTVEGNQVDETFDSGPNTFSTVNPAGDLYFPERQATAREMEGAVRGAQSSAEGAQDAAIEASDSASAARMLGILGIVLGALGIGTGAVGLAVGLRRR
jgi:hypothetical protein